MNISILYPDELKPESTNVLVHILTEEGLHERLTSETEHEQLGLEILARAQQLNDFRGRMGDFLILYPQDATANITIYVGLGPRPDLNSRQFQNAGAVLARRVSALTLQQVVLNLADQTTLDPRETIKPFIEGIAIGAYTFSKYFSTRKPFPLGALFIVIPTYLDKASVLQALDEASQNVAASNVARHLTNEASNFKTPEKFEGLLRESLANSGFAITTLHERDLELENLNLIRAVGRAGSEPPRLILAHNVTHKSAFTLGIVGKAITFDSGGFMLKAHDQLPHMREDVGGSASVIGVLSVIDRMKLDYNVVAAIPIAENLIDSKAYRPADVIITRNDISVEVSNTDAEGRLLIGDCFSYLQDKFDLNVLLDVATLTGAITRALGVKMSGYFTNNEQLSDYFQQAYTKSREKFWRMPLEQVYRSCLRSEFADIRNDGGEPKAIVAALFLEHFVHNHLPWLHLDVGSILATPSDDPLYGSKSYSSGIPTMTIMEFLRILNSQKDSLAC